MSEEAAAPSLQQQIRERAEWLQVRQGELIDELEDVSTELAALVAAEHEFTRGLLRKVKIDRTKSAVTGGVLALRPPEPDKVPGELEPEGADDPDPPAESPAPSPSPDPEPDPAGSDPDPADAVEEPEPPEPDLPADDAQGEAPGKPAPSRAAKTYQRREAIIDFLRANRFGHYSVEGLVGLCEATTSRATTRRDLDALVEDGRLEYQPRVGWRIAPEAKNDGIEKPSAPPKRSAPFQAIDGDYDIVKAIDSSGARALTAEGIALKCRVGVAVVTPRLEALTHAGILQRGMQGTGTVYAQGKRRLSPR